MLTNPGTPFDEDGFAQVLADLRWLKLRVSGGANDMNGDSTEVEQDNKADAAIPALDAEFIQGVPISKVKPIDTDPLVFSSTFGLWGPGSVFGISNSTSSVVFAGHNSGGATMSGVTPTTLTPASDIDSANGYSGSTYTIPTTGNYLCGIYGTVSHATLATYGDIDIYKNGVTQNRSTRGYANFVTGFSILGTIVGSVALSLTAGDAITWVGIGVDAGTNVTADWVWLMKIA
jgi:hypothetical protein